MNPSFTTAYGYGCMADDSILDCGTASSVARPDGTVVHSSTYGDSSGNNDEWYNISPVSDGDDGADNKPTIEIDTEIAIALAANSNDGTVACTASAVDDIMNRTGDTDLVFLYKTCRKLHKKTRRALSKHLTGTSRNYEGALLISGPSAIIIQKYVRRFLTKVRITTTTTHAIRRFKHFTFNLHPECTHRNTEKDWGATTALLILERLSNHDVHVLLLYWYATW